VARPLRIEYPGAMYHVMCRGNNGRDISCKFKYPERGQSVDCRFYIGSMIGLDVVGGEAVTHRIPWCDVSCDVRGNNGRDISCKFKYPDDTFTP
jgi:hypothetical protein